MKRVLFFLGNLNDIDVEWMLNNSSKLSLETGDRLIRKGEAIDNLYIIISGELAVCATDNHDECLAKLGTGEVVGEMAFLESRPPSVSVIATEPSVVFQIQRDKMNIRLHTNTEFRANFYYALGLFLSNRLRKTTGLLGFGDPEEEDIVDTNVLDGLAKAGSRFVQIIHRFAEA